MARRSLTGSRIRERRIMLQVRQAELARQVGISASYLNLIEHNRRRIGGKLLGDLAAALDVDFAQLAEGGDQGLYDALGRIGRAENLDEETLSQIDGLIARAPGWAQLIAAMDTRITNLERTVDGLNDRLAQDPALASAMHEVLSMVTAVRSTASILATTPEIDPNWLGRFHKNLDQDSRRLASGAEAVVAYFDAASEVSPSFATPLEEVAAFWDAQDHHIPQIEVEGAAAIPDILASVEETVAGSRRLIAQGLERYAQDAADLPMADFLPLAQRLAFDPVALVAETQVNTAQLLRRLIAIPRSAEAPEMALLICDPAGSIQYRRFISGLSLPFLGATCPLWPLFDAFAHPGRPLQTPLAMPDGARFMAWTVAQPDGPVGFAGPTVLEGTMLLQRADAQSGLEARQVGQNCRVFPCEGCKARAGPPTGGST